MEHREPTHQSDDVDDDVCFLEATLARGKLTSTNLHKCLAMVIRVLFGGDFNYYLQ